MNRSRQWKVEVRHEWNHHPDVDGWEPLTEQQVTQAGLKQRKRGRLSYMVPRTLTDCIQILRFFGRDQIRMGTLRLKNTRDGETIPLEALGLF